jgi:anti-sigma regulatory factor (Ser/Thr protein kinase)
MSHSGNPVHILSSDGKLTGFNLKLQPVEKKKFRLETVFPYELDLDRDGENEYLLYGRANSILTIARSDMTRFSRVKLPVDVSINGRFCLKNNIGKPDEFSFQYNEKCCLVSYSKNPYYPFRFLFLLLGFCVLSGVFFLTQFIQRLILREKYLTERRVSELQLLLLRNQISPHFLFNAINSISYRLMEKNPEEANNSIIRLSRLIRNNLVATDRFSRSLKEELESAIAYTEIVLSQCEEPFQFASRVEPATHLDIEVPVLVIQNYLENAVKHGVRSLGSKGRIDLVIDQDSKYLHIKISDNGIGRQKAVEIREKPDSTGKGMELMQQFFDEINKYNENKITAVVRDLSNEYGAPAGTQVNIEIPVHMKYRIYEK